MGQRGGLDRHGRWPGGRRFAGPAEKGTWPSRKRGFALTSKPSESRAVETHLDESQASTSWVLFITAAPVRDASPIHENEPIRQRRHPLQCRQHRARIPRFVEFISEDMRNSFVISPRRSDDVVLRPSQMWRKGSVSRCVGEEPGTHRQHVPQLAGRALEPPLHRRRARDPAELPPRVARRPRPSRGRRRADLETYRGVGLWPLLATSRLLDVRVPRRESFDPASRSADGRRAAADGARSRRWSSSIAARQPYAPVRAVVDIALRSHAASHCACQHFDI